MPSWRRGRSKLSTLQGAPGLERGHRGSEASHPLGGAKLLRRSCSVLRSCSCSSARQASGANPVVRLTPLSEVTERDALQLLAPTGKPLLGSFPPCSPSMSRRMCVGLKSSSRPPTLVLSAHCGPHQAPPPALPESTWDRALLWFALCGSHCSWPDWDSS